MIHAVYPGSFDPLHNGHVDVIRRAGRIFDRLTVAVAHNPLKGGHLFDAEERVEIIEEVVKGWTGIEVDSFDGLLVNYCRRKNATVILRGLRAVADFEYELQMANMNRHLNGDIVTTFIMANDAYFYVSSNLCKEVCRLGGDVSKLVPPPVEARLLDKLKPGK